MDQYSGQIALQHVVQGREKKSKGGSNVKLVTTRPARELTARRHHVVLAILYLFVSDVRTL